jgi:hypothetical protein
MKCSVKECEKEAWQKGLCTMHYSRLRRHGSLDAARPEDWGSRKKHELYDAWRELVRKKEKGRSEAWEDFWVFVKDVGDRPGDKYILSRPDDAKPFGPGNFYWRMKISTIETDEAHKEYAKRYQREYRQLHPERVKKYEMKRHFGMPAGEYEAMHEAQKGLCAICGEPETVLDSKRKLRSLSLDHDHATGKIRGLLCTRCNNGLGNFRDNPDVLRKGALYVEAHRSVK